MDTFIDVQLGFGLLPSANLCYLHFIMCGRNEAKNSWSLLCRYNVHGCVTSVCFFLIFCTLCKDGIYSQTIKGAVNVFLIEYNVHKSPSMFIFVA